jgi:hypothetical protein
MTRVLPAQVENAELGGRRQHSLRKKNRIRLRLVSGRVPDFCFYGITAR